MPEDVAGRIGPENIEQPGHAIVPAVPPSRPAMVEAVLQWMLRGGSEYEIRQAIAANFPDEQARPLIVAAGKMIENAGNPDARMVRGWAIEATRQLYQTAVNNGDLANALRAVKQLADIAGKPIQGKRPSSSAAATEPNGFDFLDDSPLSTARKASGRPKKRRKTQAKVKP